MNLRSNPADTKNAITELSSNMNTLFSRLEKKMDQQNANIRRDLDDRLGKQTLDIKNEIKSCIDLTKSELNGRIDIEIDKIHTKIDTKENDLERRLRLKDVVIKGVPRLDQDNLMEIFVNICKAVSFKHEAPYAIDNILRLNYGNKKQTKKTNGNFPVILVTFTSLYLRNHFMKQYFLYKKLCLSDIGYSQGSEHRIYVCDNLSAYHNSIYKAAVSMKSSKNLDMVTIRSGFVFVKWPGSGVLTKINCKSDLTTSNQSNFGNANNDAVKLNATIMGAAVNSGSQQ